MAEKIGMCCGCGGAFPPSKTVMIRGNEYCLACSDHIGGDTDGYDPDEEYEPDAFEEALADCSMGPDGFCGAAGSEYCDFECPVGSRPRGRKAGRK